MSPRAALTFGTVLGVVSVGVFAAAANLLAAALTLGAILYYVVVYTMLLKRRTSQSTLWGGICGAAPVLIAWATVRGVAVLAALPALPGGVLLAAHALLGARREVQG